jgi:hypothetical protein
MNIEIAKGRISEAVKQAYCIVVTVSERDEVQAFKITVSDEPHFNILKSDKRSRIQDTAITAEALLPDGPYNLWRSGETSRRVKDLAGAFAQLPHLPKMLKASAIPDTLLDGCEKGTFVLRLTRPDGTARTWWMARPDETALNDPALELVLPKAAELCELSSAVLAPKKLPGLWPADEITVKGVANFFNGSTVVQVDRDGYQEPMQIPKAGQRIIEEAVAAAVENGTLWLVSGPASILGEPIPAGILNASAKLCIPPAIIAAAEILPENLPEAWQDGVASGLSIATALSIKEGKTLPWKTIREVITAALQARFLELAEGSRAWPCDFPSAQFVKLKVSVGTDAEKTGKREPPKPQVLAAESELDPSEIQDLGDIVPELLKLKAKANVPIRFHVRIEMGDGKTLPPEELAKKFKALLKKVKDDLELR